VVNKDIQVGFILQVGFIEFLFHIMSHEAYEVPFS
jgi:hypothetical protein